MPGRESSSGMSFERTHVSSLASELRDLVGHAAAARERAYAPYSDFAVGAAVLTREGRVHVGCNVENAAYTVAICAERVAVFSAVARGERDFYAIAVIAAGDEPVSPCGPCRQVLAELAPHATIVMASVAGEILVSTCADLLPGTAAVPHGHPPPS